MTLIGYVILICDVAPGVKYFAIFLTVSGVSPNIATSISFVGSNFGPIYKRATVMGFYFTIGVRGCLALAQQFLRLTALLHSRPTHTERRRADFQQHLPHHSGTQGEHSGDSRCAPPTHSPCRPGPPQYIKGHAINLGFAAMTLVVTSTIMFLNIRENRRRNAISYAHLDGRDVDPLKLDQEEEKARWGYQGYTRQQLLELGDKHLGFRYVY